METERERERQRQRQAQRETDRQRVSQTDRQTERRNCFHRPGFGYQSCTILFQLGEMYVINYAN